MQWKAEYELKSTVEEGTSALENAQNWIKFLLLIFYCNT